MSLHTECDSFFVTNLRCQSVTYKIEQNDFDVIFLPDSPEKLSYFRCQLFGNKYILQIICLNYEIRIIFAYRSIFSQKLQR